MKFYGQFNPPVDKFIFERYFPDVNYKGVFIECGAFDGVIECSCKIFEDNMNWNGFNIEASPVNYKKLVINRPNSNNFNIGLSDKIGVMNFDHVVSPIVGENFGNGSFSHHKSHLDDLLSRGCTINRVEVNVTTYSQFVTDNKISRLDLFVLDVEGHELHVIEGMKNSNVLPDIFCIEFGHIGLDVIIMKLDELGYCFDIVSNANAFFIKKDVVQIFNFQKTNQTYIRFNEQVEVLQGTCADLSKETKSIKEQFAMQLEYVDKLYCSKIKNLENTFCDKVDEHKKLLVINEQILENYNSLQSYSNDLYEMYQHVVNTRWWKFRMLLRKLVKKY